MGVSVTARCLACLTSVALAAYCGAAARAGPPIATTVYAFTYETNTSATGATAYGVNKMDPMGGGTMKVPNINTHYKLPPALTGQGPQRREGTLEIAALRVEPDGGLVLSVRETAGGETAPPVTCVAFADTTVVCDTAQSIAPEIPAIVAMLGKNFIDPARLDANRHWSVVAQGDYGATADFTIQQKGGALLAIREHGVRAGGTAGKTSIDATMQYDFSRAMPTSLDVVTSQNRDTGALSETLTTHATFKLQEAPATAP